MASVDFLKTIDFETLHITYHEIWQWPHLANLIFHIPLQNQNMKSISAQQKSHHLQKNVTICNSTNNKYVKVR
jgi:hypothetical protein